MNGHEQNDANETPLPPRLQAELKAIYAPTRVIPPQVDDAVLAEARAQLAAVAPNRRMARIVRFPRWLAAAAAVALAALVASLWFSTRRTPDVAREDMNRDGRVDILDAFALARRLQAGTAQDPLFDIDGDGVVNRRDIDAITTRAVKLDGGQG